ncbi:50S ribosomal protein L18 [Olsenella porci]|jgi:large subunit ribosomal protein L18|uniref:Large ribosomal subunit protein uL18 n=1 Tax=Olsenella porci TaxID=2652279 RepID=A0A6N7XBM1_9ACTN|nr:50S ribosomal protein L18 [Olsenella porci]MCI1997163.1 50S ribosomal protein L18 [Olsenella sp.]MST71803.1 50S ribosomal protein L18 [Olsenella porci]
MDKNKAKRAGLKRRQRRVRAKIFGTAERPRLSVHRTNANIYAQVINDVEGKTICSASTLSPEFRETGKLGSNKEAAEFVGKLVGQRALEAGVTQVTFDRGGHIYHGRVQALADGARSAGLKF